MIKKLNKFFSGIEAKESEGFCKDVKHTWFSCFFLPDKKDWYHPVLLSPKTIGTKAINIATIKEALKVLKQLAVDDYLDYMIKYYQTGLSRFGEFWQYADILTVLKASAELIQPGRYLEVGVRRGRSMAMVAATCPACEIYGFDMWRGNYAGMTNPGPEFVKSEMKKVGHAGKIELITGNSHQTIPEFFKEHPDISFDLITVDGDHSKNGAEQDLMDVLPRLNIGGAVVFDDICHPKHPYLADVWYNTVAKNHRFSTWAFTDLGYGVAVGIRKEQ